MPKNIVHLIFPPNLIKEPIIFQAAKKFDIVPNIRRAQITATVGEVTLELSGKKEDLEKAKNFFIKTGVKCEPVVGDIVE